MTETTRYASRKFIVALLILVIGTAMTWFTRLTPELLDLLKWTAGLYFGFNVSQKAAGFIATYLSMPKEDS